MKTVGKSVMDNDIRQCLNQTFNLAESVLVIAVLTLFFFLRPLWNDKFTSSRAQNRLSDENKG